MDSFCTRTASRYGTDKKQVGTKQNMSLGEVTSCWHKVQMKMYANYEDNIYINMHVILCDFNLRTNKLLYNNENI